MATPCRRPLAPSYIWGPYGPLCAHMGPYGSIWAHMGPAWCERLGQPFASTSFLTFKISIKCTQIMTKSVYPPKCLPCFTGYIQTMFSPLHFH